MKKVRYSFISFLLVVVCATINAQMYTETMHRTTLIANGNGLCHGGTFVNAVFFSEVKAIVRGVEQFDRTFVNAYSGGDFNLLVDPGMNNPGLANDIANSMPGNLALDYVDCTNDCMIEVVAGQDFTIETLAGGHTGWANATLFVDWDGNGIFDDHDIDKYNLYGFSNFAAEEGAGDAAGGIKPKWTVKVPADYPVEKTVRVRMRIDESIDGAYKLRETALSHASTIYGATNGACNPSNSAPSWLAGMKQYFYSMYLYRFTPTGQFYKGTTVDVALKITPNPYSEVSATGSQAITATGNVACTTTNGTAITNQSGFESFLANPSGNYYLANDIILTSVPTPSCKEFTGTFDGNGHTITYPAAASVATPGVLSKDECFYPYAENYADMRTQLLSFDQKTGTMDMSNYPQYDICGGFCGKLAHSGTIKNVKVVYSGAVTYDSNKQQVLFGLVAGIAKGRVENVAVDIQQPVQVQMTTSGRPSAVGGIAGILFGGIIKNCDVNVDNSFAINTTSGYAFETSALGGFVGRLQSGVIGNVKFSGNTSGKLILLVDPTRTYTMNYIGGIAGMTNTPKSIINGDDSPQHLYWGYDNGSTGLDVNNVILAYNGSMEMTQAATGTDNFYCRGLLFGEACDTATVPNLITQYATRPTIEANCSNAQALSGTNIPLISKPLGSCNSDQGVVSTKRVGKLYLYKDGRNPANSSNCQAFTNINVTDTKLDWAYEVQTLSDGSCISFSTPYAVATYTGTNANVQGIESASANVSDLGSAMVKIDPQPADVASPSWTWSETATPVTPDTDSPVCGGGGGSGVTRPASVCTPDFGTGTNAGRYTSSLRATTSQGTFVSSTLQTAGLQNVYFDKRTETISVVQGETMSLTVGVTGDWLMGSVFLDSNNDGNFSTTERVAYDTTADGSFQTGYSFKIPDDLSVGTYTLRYITSWAHTDGCSNIGGDGNTVAGNGGIVVDYELKVIEDVPVVAPTYPTYCAGTAPNNSDGGHYGINSGYVKVNGTQAFDFTHTESVQDFSATKVVNVCPGDIITLGVNGGQHLAWSQAIAYVDWNKDGTWNENSEAYEIFNNDNFQDGRYREIDIPVPADVTDGAFCMRICSGEAPAYNSLGGGPCQARRRGKLTTLGVEVACTAVGGGGATNTYCTPVLTNVSRTDPVATGFLSSLTVNDATTPLYTSTTATIASQQSGGTITINQNESLKLDFEIGSNWNEGMRWTFAVAFVDLNGDGDFSDSGERIYEQGGTGSDQWTGTKIDAKPWNTTKTITFDASATNSMLRIFTIGEYNSGFAGSTNGSMAIYNTGCNTVAPNGTDGGSNKFHCYDFPIVINAPATGGDGCAYVANFGNVYAGEEATYDIKLGAGSGATLNLEVPDDEYTLNYNDTTGILTVTYIVPTTPGAVAVDSIGGITKGGDVYRIAVSATVKAAPTVTFRMSDAGGGALSLDMGKTKFIESRTFAPYKGELLTAVPVGPTHITGWHFSTDGGATWTDVGHANPDYTYTGADDAIVEVRFDFDDFEGTFGNSRFTDNSNVPFYISAISTTNGIVNVNATNVFIEDSVREVGKARWRYMENQRLQTLHMDLNKRLVHDITVTVQNANKIPADARLMCFVDYNMNNYFDFASSPDGLASALSKNGELVFVADPNDTEAEQTFTFKISNDSIDQFGKTRMRFMVATYVDMYGLGPVNQYGNYQPRIDTDGDGFADQELPLNDNNGSLYTPNNQCRLENYVNVADVTFEVVAFIRYNDVYTIKNGESVRMKNLYIEAQESEAGLQSGRIVFDKNAPYGSLIIEDKIIVRRRIYPDQWHDIAFPIEMQGVGGANGICAVGANGTLDELPADKVALWEFNSAKRNQQGGYGKAFDEVKADTLPSFKATKLYKFAADVPDSFVANNAGDGIDGVLSYWIQFHSVKDSFTITPSAAKTDTITFTGENKADAEYWNKNVFTLYNPFLSNINVKEVTSSLGWENITWWNAAKGKYEGVSAAETRDMPPFFGYWIQLTENVADSATVSVVLGDASRQDYPYANEDGRVVDFVHKMAPRASLSSSFDVPDAYTVGIDAAADASNAKAVSTTMVTLTDDGSVDEFRAGYDMPVSLSTTSTSIPEIWTKAGSTSMMFNDVQRKDEVVVPMGIRIKEAGEYALRLTHTNDTTSLVQLRDKETGALVDLQSDGQASTYLFLADEGDANRFDLIISKAPKMVTDLEFVETLQGEQNAQVYVRGDNLCLSNISTDYSVSVCDVLGREYLRTPITDSEMTIPLPVMRGVYVVNILDEQNASIQSVKLTK